jgi:uncharacterized protein YndB with AHSA1/START domain
MLKTMLLIVAAAIAALLIYAATKPDTFRLSRSATIAAPPDKVFALINDLRQFNTWNPFAKMDPKQVITYDTVTAGVGGAYNWQGEKSGAGRMQIAESVPAQRVTATLDFTKPFEAHNTVDFTIAPQADGKSSQVTWAMHGPAPYINKLMTIFFDMDKSVGGEFENGLASLKALAEKP